MIRQLKFQEKYKFKNKEGIQNRIFVYENIKVFVNDENLTHNDVGPAWDFGNMKGNWCWNGLWIK